MAEIRNGTIRVKAIVAFYAGLKAGRVGDVPAHVAQQAIAAGYAVAVDDLTDRVAVPPVETETADHAASPVDNGQADDAGENADEVDEEEVDEQEAAPEVKKAPAKKAAAKKAAAKRV